MSKYDDDSPYEQGAQSNRTIETASIDHPDNQVDVSESKYFEGYTEQIRKLCSKGHVENQSPLPQYNGVHTSQWTD